MLFKSHVPRLSPQIRSIVLTYKIFNVAIVFRSSFEVYTIRINPDVKHLADKLRDLTQLTVVPR